MHLNGYDSQNLKKKKGKKGKPKKEQGIAKPTRLWRFDGDSHNQIRQRRLNDEKRPCPVNSVVISKWKWKLKKKRLMEEDHQARQYSTLMRQFICFLLLVSSDGRPSTYQARTKKFVSRVGPSVH